MKRVLCAAAALTLVLLCVACSPGSLFNKGQDAASAAAPQGGSQEPVKVTETHANAETVQAASPTPAPETAPTATPATGDLPIVPLAGAIGLILICSAGLLMLRRI